MPTGCGAPLRKTPLSLFDASCVAQLRAAGATPIGKTVTAEYAFAVPGPTRNPWNPAHTTGGSSSGPAEIGTAECRARVGQSLDDAVAAGQLQKNKIIISN